MAEELTAGVKVGAAASVAGPASREKMMATVEAIAIPIGAIIVSLLLFGLFVALAGVSPVDLYQNMWEGSFGTWFSIQNALTRASPLILTALCTALPAQLGLMIIGGEGSLIIGGLAATVVGVGMKHDAPLAVQVGMAAAGIAVGGIWTMLAGGLRHWRGVNETISSLLLVYIAIAILNQSVEGVFRDPASLNKPSSPSIGDANMIGNIPGTEVHWGLVIGIVVCVACYILLNHTVFGFSARVAGGNVRTARMVGLPVGRLIMTTCFIAGGAAGLAGMIEVAAVQERANASLIAGYGYTGILVSFLARHNPLAIIPVAILMGGISASGGLLQRHLDLPDAATTVLQGIIFVVILTSECVYGRIPWLTAKGK